MLRLTYSNRFEELVLALCEQLAKARKRRGSSLFRPPPLLVPNHHLAAYIKLALAQQAGVAANLAFTSPAEFIADCVPADRPELRVLDTDQLQAALISVLADEDAIADDELAPVREYLYSAGDGADEVDLRRFQLAETVAALLADYRLERPDMLRRWLRGPALEDTRRAADERWQRRLWLALFAPERGLIARIEADTGARWIPGPDLFEEVLIKDMGLPATVHMIGFSHLPWAYHSIIAKLARYRDVLVYTLNPCMEYWEDLRAGWETRMAGRQLRRRDQVSAQLSFSDVAELSDFDDTPALRLWGRPGRENTRILNEITGCDFDARFVDPGEGQSGQRDGPEPARLSMLTALQRDMLFRTPARDQPDPNVDPDDDSVQILGCPSVQRELEVIGNEIWRLLARDPSLRCNDIAVLISDSDRETYQAHVPAVFGELHQIPYHFAEVSLSTDSRVVEALLMILALPFGRFTRPELLRVLTHPAVLARYPDVDPNDWVHWSERLGIVHGADHDDHADTYIERDLFNWQQGIRRLALGAFMAGEHSGPHPPMRIGDSAYLPEPIPADRLPSAARFSLVARSLISDARYCRDAEKPLAQWRVFFDLLLSSYLAPIGADDERNLSACREAIARLAECDLDDRPVRYRIACELLRQKLRGLSDESGELLARGVTIAPLLPMRPIPYRVIFMAGLGEGHFPAAEPESPLDLRAAKRRRGDTSARERDRYLFLETILSARQRLYLSYVSRDDQSGERLQPSPLILELAHLLRRSYRHRQGEPTVALEHPLRRYDPRYFPALFAPTAPRAPSPADAPSPTSDPSAADPGPAPTPASPSDPTADAASEPAAPAADAADAADAAASEPNPADAAATSAPAADREAAATALDRDAPLLSAAPAAHRQAHVLALRRDLESTLRAQGQDMPSMRELTRALRGPRFARLREQLRLTELTPPEPDRDRAEGRVSISLARLRGFLESPLQAWAAEVLRLRESDLDDLVTRADEAFSTPLAPMVGILRDVFSQHISSEARDLDALVARYRARAHRLELSGQGPTGVFSDIDRERHLDILTRWYRHLEAITDPLTRFRHVGFGRSPEGLEHSALVAPITLTVELRDGSLARPIQVDVFGHTEALGGPEIGSLVLNHRPDERKKYLLRGFLDHVALSAAGHSGDRAHAITVLSTGQRSQRYQLDPFSQEQARAYLGALIAELLGGPHEYLLPCEAVFAWQNKPDTPLAHTIEVRRDTARGMSCLYGPVARIDNLSPPRDAEAMAERRFGPLFERLRVIEPR